MEEQGQTSAARSPVASPSSATFHLLCGAGAGLLSDMVVHPVDTCRTRLQVQRGHASSGALFYKNTVDAFAKIVQLEGAKALYKGFAIVTTFTVPAHALYFWGYETAKRTLRPSVPLEEKGPLVHFASGIFADIMGSFVWVPQDVVKQRLQVQKTSLKAAASETFKYKGTLHCISTIIKEEGFFALWTGFLPALAVYCPFVGIYFVIYEQSKLIFCRIRGCTSGDALPFPYHLVGGATAGAIAAALTSPLDIIKTRIQVGSDYKGPLDAAQRILKEEGPRAFVKGIGARVLWIAPATAITMAAYEQLSRYFSP